MPLQLALCSRLRLTGALTDLLRDCCALSVATTPPPFRKRSAGVGLAWKQLCEQLLDQARVISPYSASTLVHATRTGCHIRGGINRGPLASPRDCSTTTHRVAPVLPHGPHSITGRQCQSYPYLMLIERCAAWGYCHWPTLWPIESNLVWHCCRHCFRKSVWHYWPTLFSPFLWR